MSRFVENMARHVHSRRMVEQDMGWLEEFRDDPDWPQGAVEPVRVWRSRDFQAMLFIDRDNGMRRLAVTRVEFDKYTGEYRDGITWDDLQKVKNETVGEDCWAVECYPPERFLQNVANMRHLWILDGEPRFGWKQPVCMFDESDPDYEDDYDDAPPHGDVPVLGGSVGQVFIGGES
ncbi:DUF7694 domain-containing protein [Bifidobacterium samirii]|uniref:DUF7694 domain-containing protein n=1 Tax=Bifidobacterium samirii TaxID=2306974 RepID=A0A430FUA3_9BIFI|nr:hypothetical protein [Bifidobacterium samirii]RSX56750.1 hypothetical protein D2E24_1040 [Bifidobacterium samirii]